MKKLLLLLGTVSYLFGSIGVCVATPVQWSSTVGGNDHWYEAISLPYISWTDAKLAAEELEYLGLKGHLATITSDAENSFLFNLLPDNSVNNPYWLGGFQDPELPEPPTNSGWQWVTGETWSYTNWNGGEPNGVNEDALTFTLGGKWNDAPTWYNLYTNGGYVVEFEPVPEPTTMLLLGTGLLVLAGARRRMKK